MQPIQKKIHKVGRPSAIVGRGHRAFWPVLDMMDNRQAVDHMTTLETDALTLAKQPFLIPLTPGRDLSPDCRRE